MISELMAIFALVPMTFIFNDDYDDNEYSAHCDDWRHLRQSDAGTVPHPAQALDLRRRRAAQALEAQADS